eukprot:5008365-Ditylum_brightwellii.AAC.2
MAAEDIWGPDVGCLQGKTAQAPSNHARQITIGISLCIIENHMQVIVVADILIINGMQFFISMSRKLRFITGEFTTHAYESTLKKGMIHVVQTYKKRYFQVKHILMDGQFKCLQHKATEMDINLIICSEDKHIGNIEHLNRTIQERI